MPRLPLTSLMVVLLAGCGVALIGGVAITLAVAKPGNAGAPDYRVVSIGGLQYESMLGRPIDPANPVDAAIVRGLPAGERGVRPGEMLFGAFIAVSNDSPKRLPAATSVELRGDSQHVYRPLQLPASNAYAYAPRSIPPNTRVPGVGTAADDNLAATGYLLLFRVPAYYAREGQLELVIHEPGHPSSTASLDV